MKKVFSLVWIVLGSVVLLAQDYEQAMQKAFQYWEQGQMEQAVVLFEQIGQVEKDNWLPYYYAANVDIVYVFQSDTDTWEAYLQRAGKNLEQAGVYSPQNSEVSTMEGLLYTAYVARNPGVYGAKYSGKIIGLHHKAIAQDSLNPRAHMNLIEYEMGYARFMQEDLEPYCTKMADILPYFDSDSVNYPFAPTYGKDRALEIISNCEDK